MPINFITADQRLAQHRTINQCILGPSGIGKTTLARTLDPKSTLFINAEAGDLALQDWPGTIYNIREEAQRMGCHPWELARALACIVSGADPAATDPSDPYSAAMYDSYVSTLGGPQDFAAYDTIFWDSITVAARWSFSWAQAQPQAFSEKTGKKDMRSAYGLHGQEMVKWLTIIQHTAGKSTIVVGILDRIVDDMHRVSWEPQIEGGKTGRELPGIFDQVMTLQYILREDGTPWVNEATGEQYRGIYTSNGNAYGYPAKDRTGRLDPIEPPDLGALIRKVQTANTTGSAVNTSMPVAA